MKKVGTDRRAWTQQEDAAIFQLVKEHGLKNWSLISDKMAEMGVPSRTGK